MTVRWFMVGAGVIATVAFASCGSSEGGTGALPATTMKLDTPSYHTLAPASTSTTAPAVDDGGGLAPGQQNYTIVNGDYLYGIAKRYCVTADDIVTVNAWSDGVQHRLDPGEPIVIPANGCVPGTAPSDTPEATTPAATSTTFDPKSGGTYVVVANDTLSGIAAKTGTTVDALVAANGWSDGVTHVIIPGQSIRLPARTG